MTDERSRITANDRRAAEKWVMRMLDEPERHEEGLEHWIAEKPARQNLYVDLMRDVQAAGHAASHIPPATQDRAPASRPVRRKLPFAVAAFLLLGVGAAGALYWTRDGGHSVTSSEQARNSVPFVTNVGEVRTITLDDGTRIIMDTDTLLHVHMAKDRRDVVMRRGRARFIVAHDATRPFYVKADGIRIRATGTVFDVLVRNNVAVHLLEGGVEIEARASTGNALKKLMLRPGLIFALQAGAVSKTWIVPARPSDEQWVDGVKSFDNVPIREVIAEANSYSRTKIELVPASLGDQEIFADIDVRDIERVAETVSGFLDLEIERDDRRLVLRKKN